MILEGLGNTGIIVNIVYNWIQCNRQHYTTGKCAYPTPLHHMLAERGNGGFVNSFCEQLFRYCGGSCVFFDSWSNTNSLF